MQNAISGFRVVEYTWPAYGHRYMRRLFVFCCRVLHAIPSNEAIDTVEVSLPVYSCWC